MERGGEWADWEPDQPEQPTPRGERSETVKRILFTLALDQRGGNVFIPPVSKEFVRQRLEALKERVRRIQSGEEEFNDFK